MSMGDVSVTWAHLMSRDPDLVSTLEREVRAAAALAPMAVGPLICRILASRPQTLSLQLNLPGWTKVLCLPLPATPGSVRAAVQAALVTRLSVPTSVLGLAPDALAADVAAEPTLKR
jgi:hypothetical protein